jgi:hypothetical protein
VVEDAARLRDALATVIPDNLPATFLQPLPDPLRDYPDAASLAAFAADVQQFALLA